MDSSEKSKFKQIVKKPVVLVGAVLIVLLVLLVTLFGGSGGVDPIAKSLKDLANQHEATLELIDDYSREVKSSKLKASLSQVSIILTADKNDIDLYFKNNFKTIKEVKSSVSSKPDKELIKALDDAAILNNLESSLRNAVAEELRLLGSSINKIRKENLGDKSLVGLMDKLTLNTQTMTTRLNEGV